MRFTFALILGTSILFLLFDHPAFAKNPGERTGVCEMELARATEFATMDEAVATVIALRDHVANYLTPSESARVNELLTSDRRASVETDADDLATLAALFERSKRNFFREFREQAALADEAIADRIKRARRRHVEGDLTAALSLRTKFKHCQRKPTFEGCVATWRRIQSELKSRLKRAPRTFAPKTTSNAGRPADEVFRLDVLGSEEQKETLRRAFERTFDSPGAEARQVRRDDAEADGRGRRQEYTRVSNLNRALSFFTQAPRIIERTSKVMLNGPAVVGSHVKYVNVVFDPRDRYVTVQVPDGVGDERYYFRLTLLGDGRVMILDDEPLPKSLVFENIRETHLAY